jgi:murein L,D-transpeptidase YcbB/YkuD
MSVLRSAFICAMAMLAAPAFGTEAALPAGAAPTSGNHPPAPVLSDQAQAAKQALDEAKESGDAIEKLVLAGVRSFYEGRDFELLWIPAGKARPQMSGLARRMRAAQLYGLDPDDYALPGLALAYPDDVKLRAEVDVAFSRAVALFVTHLASGRMRPAEISRIITLEPQRPEVGDALARLSRTAGVAAALHRYEPAHPQYRALKAALAELRAANDDTTRVVVPEGALLRPGKRDARVPALRARLGLAGAPDGEPDRYDDVLVMALEAFQAEAGLTVDGILGPRTLAALNGVSREEDVAAVIANIERWRWMPRDLGKFHVMVNVPEFMVRVVRDGVPVHETRVVVGTPSNPTPTFSHVMDHLVVNPYWNVPVSIVSAEMLPEIRRNPSAYFGRRGYQVFARAGGKMRRVHPGSVDWWMVNPRSIRIRQAPGDLNALGRIKFMFLNQHSVYLHDTPSKSLFKRDVRAFSHGCVRVEEPLAFADAILPVAAPEWNSARLQKLYGGPERRINLDNPIPVHLSYFTRAVDARGELRRAADVYGYDRRMAERTGV